MADTNQLENRPARKPDSALTVVAMILAWGVSSGTLAAVAAPVIPIPPGVTVGVATAAGLIGGYWIIRLFDKN